jgi:hypothetical protein
LAIGTNFATLVESPKTPKKKCEDLSNFLITCVNHAIQEQEMRLAMLLGTPLEAKRRAEKRSEIMGVL